MTENIHPPGKRSHLALAMAQGISVASWARSNKVARRTAYRWASEKRVQAAVHAYRNRAMDRAVGLMARHVTRAAKGIITLANDADSESVKLSALRAIFSDMITISNYSGLERRMAQIEEKIREEPGSADQPS